MDGGYYVTNTGQRCMYLGSSCSREPLENIDNSISMYKYFTMAKQTTMIIPPEKF